MPSRAEVLRLFGGTTVNNKFYTLKGYALLENSAITPSMEDYLEMIYRILSGGEAVRIGALAENLNVKPSSASKMVNNLKTQGLVLSEKYGYIKLTDAGLALGNTWFSGMTPSTAYYAT